jgi:hypothetical protein
LVQSMACPDCRTWPTYIVVREYGPQAAAFPERCARCGRVPIGVRYTVSPAATARHAREVG